MATETFGQKMKLALANRGVQLEDVARATGVELEHLRALERGDYAALPDEARVADSLRSFAAFVEVDGDAVIEDYLHDRQAFAPVPAAPHIRTHEGVPPIAHAPRRRRSLAPVALAAVAVVMLATLAWWWIRPTEPTEPSRVPVTVAAPVDVPVELPVDVRPTDEPARDPGPTPARLVVEEHGVGTGVADRRLVGAGERFAEGSKVWFWTRIVGAAPGETIRHVWLHDGTEVSGVTLTLGGSPWRTQSAKTLNAGSAGSWTVEARDDSGRVLARSEFACTSRRAD